MKTFHNPVKIVFSDNIVKSLPDILGKRKAFFITSSGWKKRGLMLGLNLLLIKSSKDASSPSAVSKSTFPQRFAILFAVARLPPAKVSS